MRTKREIEFENCGGFEPTMTEDDAYRLIYPYWQIPFMEIDIPIQEDRE